MQVNNGSTTTNAYPNRDGTPRLTPSSLCSKSSSKTKSACDSAERDASLGGFWSILTSMGGSGPRPPMSRVVGRAPAFAATPNLRKRGVIMDPKAARAPLASGGRDAVPYQYHTRIGDNSANVPARARRVCPLAAAGAAAGGAAAARAPRSRPPSSCAAHPTERSADTCRTACCRSRRP